MVNQDVTNPATTNLPVEKPSTSRQKPRQPRQSQGFTRLLRGRDKTDAQQLDGRSAFAQAMNQYRTELLASLGGEDNLSAQELTLVEMCAKDWLLLQTVDAYMLQAGIFNKKKRTSYPLTVQRMQIAVGLMRRLQSLGLKRRAKPARSLGDLLSKGSVAE